MRQIRMFNVASMIQDLSNFNKNSISPLINSIVTDDIFLVLHISVCRSSRIIKFKTL